jgi:hypothetical protein
MVGLGLLVGLACPIGATVLIPLQIEDMARLAPVVVVGEVNRVEVNWNREKTKIYTRVLISPIEVLKGPGSPGTILIKTIGGTVGKTVAQLPGAPKFEVGERVLVFLEPREDGDGYLTLGLYLGKFKVFNDPKTGREMLLRPGLEPGVTIYRAVESNRVETVKTLDEVRALVHKAGGGR